jgi:hypothetical protein
MSRRRRRGMSSTTKARLRAAEEKKQQEAAAAAAAAKLAPRLRELEQQALHAQETAMQALMLEAENKMRAEMEAGKTPSAAEAAAAVAHPGGVITVQPEAKKGIGMGTVALIGGAALVAILMAKS